MSKCSIFLLRNLDINTVSRAATACMKKMPFFYFFFLSYCNVFAISLVYINKDHKINDRNRHKPDPGTA